MRFGGFIWKKKYAAALLAGMVIYAGSLLCSSYNIPEASAYKIMNDSAYAGSVVCAKCHQALYDSFITTAHYNTSRPGNINTVKGNTRAGYNSFDYNLFTRVTLQQIDSMIWQVAYINGEIFQSQPVDIVIGSGRKGQTYLYWKDKQLFQLPVSYYSPGDKWCNSPGYPAGFPKFDRQIPARCIECHGSYAVAEKNVNGLTYFDKGSIEFGVTCERCHGPAAKHVAYQLSHPQEKSAFFILTQKELSRQQQLDVCALCHSGIRKEVQPAFSFVAGNKLEDFSLPVYNKDSISLLDVHGNQYGLLQSSKCFLQSTITCSTCHNVHETQINLPAMYSKKCMNCHTEAAHNTCSMKPVTGLNLADNCIDCHMPLMPSNKIFLQMNDASLSTADYVRTHRIAVYNDASRDFIRKFKKAAKR